MFIMLRFRESGSTAYYKNVIQFRYINNVVKIVVKNPDSHYRSYTVPADEVELKIVDEIKP